MDLERLWTAQEAMRTWRGAVKLPLSEKTMPEAVLSVVVNEEVTVMLRVKMITSSLSTFLKKYLPKLSC